jgi:hypothetical protein
MIATSVSMIQIKENQRSKKLTFLILALIGLCWFNNRVFRAGGGFNYSCFIILVSTHEASCRNLTIYIFINSLIGFGGDLIEALN